MGLPVMTSLPTLWLWRNGRFRASRIGGKWDAVPGEDAEAFQDETPTPQETPNLPAVWVNKPPVLYVKPAKRRFRIERCPSMPSSDVPGVDDFPWYVQETTHGDDRDDYGRMGTHQSAVGLVAFMMKGQRYGTQ